MGIKYSVNEDFFKTWSRNSAYILGFIYADGHLENAFYIRGKYIRISNTDFSIIRRIKQTLDSSHKIVTIPAKDNRKEKYILRIGSHKMYYDLENLSLTPRKSLNMKFPEVPSEFLLDFVRGYFDGDGTITFEHMKNKPHDRLKVIFTSGSKVFLLSLANVLRTYCVDKIEKVHNSHRSYQLMYRSKNALKILDFMYSRLKKEESLYLERKYNKYQQLLSEPDKFRCGNLIDKSSRIWTYRTRKNGVVPKGLRELSAKQLFTGSSPVHA